MIAHKANTASAYLIYVLEVAERGNVDMGGSCRFKNGTALIYGIISAVDLYINFFHYLNSP